MRLGHFKPVHVKSRTSQGIQTIIAARAQIVSAMVRLELTARGLIKKFGHKISRGGRVSFAERVRVAIANDADLCIAINPLLESRETLRQQKLGYDRTLYALSKNNSVCRALMSVPGVGPVTSLAFVAVIDDPMRFSTSRSVGAHLGLTPRTYQSGEIDHNGHISKCGDKLITKRRAYFYHVQRWRTRSKHGVSKLPSAQAPSVLAQPSPGNYPSSCTASGLNT